MRSLLTVMWRNELTNSSPAESRYFNGVRSYNGALYYPSPGVLNTLPSVETLADAMYSVDDGRLQSMKPCKHYRIVRVNGNGWWSGIRAWYSTNHGIPNPGYWTFGPYTSEEVWDEAFTASVTPSSHFGTWRNPVKGLPLLATSATPEPGYNLCPSVSSSQRNLLLQRALASMLPGIKASLSVPNALYELKDFRTVGRSLNRINQALDTYPALIRRDLRALGRHGSLRNKPLRIILRGIADSYLQASFNILPLLSDLAKLRGSFNSLRRDLEDLRSRANSHQRRHFACPLDGFPDETGNAVVTLPSFMVTPTLTASRVVRHEVRMFHATMVYSYKLPAINESLFGLLGLLDRLGINLNPAIIWNAIPWSFVVDWLFGVSRWLNQFQLRNIEPEVHIHGFCYSLNVKRTIQTYVNVDGQTGPVMTLSETAYERNVGLDQGALTSSIQSSGLNPKEFSLSAALALSR